jgi:hypothetical protein
MGLVTTSPGSGIIILGPQRVERDERIFDFSFKCKTCHVCFFGRIVGFPILALQATGKGSLQRNEDRSSTHSGVPALALPNFKQKQAVFCTKTVNNVVQNRAKTKNFQWVINCRWRSLVQCDKFEHCYGATLTRTS